MNRGFLWRRHVNGARHGLGLDADRFDRRDGRLERLCFVADVGSALIVVKVVYV